MAKDDYIQFLALLCLGIGTLFVVKNRRIIPKIYADGKELLQSNLTNYFPFLLRGSKTMPNQLIIDKSKALFNSKILNIGEKDVSWLITLPTEKLLAMRNESRRLLTTYDSVLTDAEKESVGKVNEVLEMVVDGRLWGTAIPVQLFTNVNKELNPVTKMEEYSAIAVDSGAAGNEARGIYDELFKHKFGLDYAEPMSSAGIYSKWRKKAYEESSKTTYNLDGTRNVDDNWMSYRW